jgi:hypothetical protein
MMMRLNTPARVNGSFTENASASARSRTLMMKKAASRHRGIVAQRGATQDEERSLPIETISMGTRMCCSRKLAMFEPSTQ